MTLEGVLSSLVRLPSSTDQVLVERRPHTTRIPVAINDIMDTAITVECRRVQFLSSREKDNPQETDVSTTMLSSQIMSSVVLQNASKRFTHIVVFRTKAKYPNEKVSRQKVSL